jgi:hypothetical protein
LGVDERALGRTGYLAVYRDRNSHAIFCLKLCITHGQVVKSVAINDLIDTLAVVLWATDREAGNRG